MTRHLDNTGDYLREDLTADDPNPKEVGVSDTASWVPRDGSIVSAPIVRDNDERS